MQLELTSEMMDIDHICVSQDWDGWVASVNPTNDLRFKHGAIQKWGYLLTIHFSRMVHSTHPFLGHPL